jgi:hypothetical protein
MPSFADLHETANKRGNRAMALAARIDQGRSFSVTQSIIHVVVCPALSGFDALSGVRVLVFLSE